MAAAASHVFICTRGTSAANNHAHFWRICSNNHPRIIASANFHAPQMFDGAVFTNGVFLGPIAHLTFDGPYTMSGRQLTFDVSNMGIGLGPFKFSIPLKKDAKPLTERDAA